MITLKANLIALTASLLLILALSLILPLPSSAKTVDSVTDFSKLDTSIQAIGNVASIAVSSSQTSIISGTYAGTVAITSPVQLGVLDMAFDIGAVGDTLTGTVDLARTLVYTSSSGAPVLHGVVTGTDSLTPTFRLSSATFDGFVSGREVQRSFTLVGDAIESGEILQGTYTEIITGFMPDPMVLEGIFMVTRPPEPQDFDTLASVAIETAEDELWITGGTVVSGTLLDGYRDPFTTTTVVTLSTNLGAISPITMEVSDGVFTATFDAGTNPGVATIAATTGDLTGATSVEVLAYSAAALELSPQPDDLTLPTDGGQVTFTVTVQDQIGQPVSGTVVTFAGLLGTVSPLSATTGANGVVTVTFTAGAMPGQASVEASCNNLTETVAFQLETPEVSALDLQIDTVKLEPGVSTPISVTVMDQFGRSMASELVSLFGSLGTVNPSSGLSDSAGRVVATFTAGSLETEATITALSGYASASITINIQGSGGECVFVESVEIEGPNSAISGTEVILQAAYIPTDATDVAFLWENGDTTSTTIRTLDVGTHTLAVTATNCSNVLVTDTHKIAISAAPVCTDVTSVDLSQVTRSTIYTDTEVAFEADIAPDDAAKPYTYTIDYGDGISTTATSSADPLTELTHTFTATGSYDVEIAVWNCEMSEPITDMVDVIVSKYGTCVDLTSITIEGDTTGYVGPYTFTTTYSPSNATLPITYTWNNGDITSTTLRALDVGTHTLMVTATNCSDVLVTDTHTITISAAPVCTDVTGVDLSQVTRGTIYTDTEVAFEADIAPDDAAQPYTYTIDYGDGISTTATSNDDPLTELTHTFTATGAYEVEIAVWNCERTEPITDTVGVIVTEYGVSVGLSNITIEGKSEGTPGIYTFTTAYQPLNATLPITYTWDNGDVTSTTVRTLDVGMYTLSVTATNVSATWVTDTHIINLPSSSKPKIYLPLVLKNR